MGRGIVLGQATECGDDLTCAKLAQLISAVSEIKYQLEELATNVNEKLNKQAEDLEELKTDLKKTLASTATIFAQLRNHSTYFLSHDEHLEEHDVLQGNEHQLVVIYR